jgi:hypothetical protein
MVVLVSDREGERTTDIFVMFTDGTGVLSATHDPADDEDPQWVP